MKDEICHTCLKSSMLNIEKTIFIPPTFYKVLPDETKPSKL